MSQTTFQKLSWHPGALSCDGVDAVTNSSHSMYEILIVILTNPREESTLFFFPFFPQLSRIYNFHTVTLSAHCSLTPNTKYGKGFPFVLEFYLHQRSRGFTVNNISLESTSPLQLICHKPQKKIVCSTYLKFKTFQIGGVFCLFFFFFFFLYFFGFVLFCLLFTAQQFIFSQSYCLSRMEWIESRRSPIMLLLGCSAAQSYVLSYKNINGS